MKRPLLNCLIVPVVVAYPAEIANIHVIEESERVDQEVIVRATQIVKQHKQFWNLANLDWVKANPQTPSFPM